MYLICCICSTFVLVTMLQYNWKHWHWATAALLWKEPNEGIQFRFQLTRCQLIKNKFISGSNQFGSVCMFNVWLPKNIQYFCPLVPSLPLSDQRHSQTSGLTFYAASLWIWHWLDEVAHSSSVTFRAISSHSAPPFCPLYSPSSQILPYEDILFSHSQSAHLVALINSANPKEWKEPGCDDLHTMQMSYVYKSQDNKPFYINTRYCW